MNIKLKKKINDSETEIINKHQSDIKLFEQLYNAQNNLGVVDSGRLFSLFFALAAFVK